MLKLNHAGDTIVEVMIALAVLSLAFAISYATASNALRDSQNAQEHSLAVDYIDQQLEALQFLASQQGSSILQSVLSGATPFCLYSNNGQISYAVTSLPPNVPNQDCEQPGNGFSYAIYDNREVQPSTIVKEYSILVTIAWPGLGNLGKQCSLPGFTINGEQCEQLAYRVYSQ